MKVYKLIRQLLHLIFGWHYWSTEDVGITDPHTYCEFCDTKKRLRDACEKNKHRWHCYGVSGLVTETRHFVCTTCGAKGTAFRSSV